MWVFLFDPQKGLVDSLKRKTYKSREKGQFFLTFFRLRELLLPSRPEFISTPTQTLHAAINQANTRSVRCHSYPKF
jgi:hypothetical protein